MKNACIVLRDNRVLSDGADFLPLLTALTEGGYPQDKIFLLNERDSREFAQTFVECKNFFENLFIFVPQDSLGAVRSQAAELLKCEPAPVMETGQKSCFVFPSGREGERAVRAEILPNLEKKYGGDTVRAVFRCVGVPQERAEAVLTEIKHRGEGAFDAVYSETFGDGRLELRYSAQTPARDADELLRFCTAGLNDYLYALDDTPLHMRVAELLKLRGKKLCVAESFTGGGVTRRLVSVPGVSEVLEEGIVAYANEAKMRRLGVRGETLVTHGAVSDETAYEMAAGLIAAGKCNVSVATTGIAGPSSDGSRKPVGLCYIAVGTPESVYVYKYLFGGDREEITERAINQALFLLYKNIR